MAVNFPNSPNVNDQVTISGRIYEWDGEKWNEITPITKASIGLDNVENYGTASTAEAEAGTATDKYMTPERTAEAIAELSPPTDVSTEFSAGVIETNDDINLKFWRGTQADFDAIPLVVAEDFTSQTITSTYSDGSIQTTIPFEPIPFNSSEQVYEDYANYVHNLKLYVKFANEASPVLIYDGPQDDAPFEDDGNLDVVDDGDWNSLSISGPIGSSFNFLISGVRTSDTDNTIDFDLWFGTDSTGVPEANFVFLDNLSATNDYEITIEQMESGADANTRYIITDEAKLTANEYTLTVLATDWAEETSGDFESNYKAVLTLSGLASSDNPSVELDLTGETRETVNGIITDFEKIFAWQVSDDDEITFYANAEPTEDLTLHLQVVK